MKNEGKLSIQGDARLRVNPPAVDSSGITVSGTAMTVRVHEDGVVLVGIVGRATYADGREASFTLNIDPSEELVAALNNMMQDHAATVHSRAIDAAASALGVARAQGEL